jgi:hypothetical protein
MRDRQTSQLINRATVCPTYLGWLKIHQDQTDFIEDGDISAIWSATKQMKVIHIPTEDMIADILTKPLPASIVFATSFSGKTRHGWDEIQLVK